MSPETIFEISLVGDERKWLVTGWKALSSSRRNCWWNRPNDRWYPHGMAPLGSKLFHVSASIGGRPSLVEGTDTMDQAKAIGTGWKQKFDCAVIITNTSTRREYSMSETGDLSEIG